MKTSEKILEYLQNHGPTSGYQLSKYLGITDRAVRKQLEGLMSFRQISKIGKPPKVYYKIAVAVDDAVEVYSPDPKSFNIIQKSYLYITPKGEYKSGFDGFVDWLTKKHLPIEKTISEYIMTMQKYGKYKNRNGLIDGTEKLNSTFSNVFLDKIYYVDFYSIERFGKTKLGQLLLYAKQSQEPSLVKSIAEIVRPKIDILVKKFKIDGVGFIPPTVKRQIQLMRELEKDLNLALRKVNIIKVKTPIAVPQKSLNKLEDRVENAKSTFVVDDQSKFNNILLIDDAVGSGATLNETARKIRDRNLVAGKIIGLAVSGSFKGFDIISEV